MKAICAILEGNYEKSVIPPKNGEIAENSSFVNQEGHQLHYYILIINSVILAYLFRFQLLYVMRYFNISYKYD